MWTSLHSHNFSFLPVCTLASATLFSGCVPVWGRKKKLPVVPQGIPVKATCMQLCFSVFCCSPVSMQPDYINPWAQETVVQQDAWGFSSYVVYCLPGFLSLLSQTQSTSWLLICASAISPPHIDTGGLLVRSEYMLAWSCWSVRQRAWLSVFLSEKHQGRLH